MELDQPEIKFLSLNESNTLFRDLDHLSCDKGVLYRKTKINGEERIQDDSSPRTPRGNPG